MPKDKHSPAGKLYRQLGDKGTEQAYATRQRTQRLKRRVDALGHKTAHAKGSTAAPSGPLSSADWHKREGRSVSQSSLRLYRGYKRNFGR